MLWERQQAPSSRFPATSSSWNDRTAQQLPEDYISISEGASSSLDMLQIISTLVKTCGLILINRRVDFFFPLRKYILKKKSVVEDKLELLDPNFQIY